MVRPRTISAAAPYHFQRMAELLPSVQEKMMAMAATLAKHGFTAGTAQPGVN